MPELLLTVTDHELLAGQVAKSIFVLLLLFGAVYNLWRAIRFRELLRAGLAAFFFLIALPVIRWIVIEDGLLRKPAYAVGITVGYCQAFARGKAIEFEYEVQGRAYRNCNAFHPIPIDSIVVPGGKYAVRYSARFPDKGRIDFHRKVN